MLQNVSLGTMVLLLLSSCGQTVMCDDKGCPGVSSDKLGTVQRLQYEDMKKELKGQGTVLIDVRNKDELETDGKIAESKNIPLCDLQDALKKMSDVEFKKKYSFDKPKQSDHIIVHCKSGVRAEKGASVFLENGYSDVRIYPGILDWKKNGGPVVLRS